MDEFFARVTEIALQLVYLAPVGFIGLWRWSVWLIRKLLGVRYEPTEVDESFDLTASLIIPVYNEDPVVFREALASWQGERPDEIIAVIDYTDERCIAAFNEFANEHDNARLIVTRKPGKRAALADGIKVAASEIVILIDSDSIWSEGILRVIKAPFADAQVGGVGTRQNVRDPQSLAQKLFDVHLDSRYYDEIRFLAASGDALTCLSGRTAAYRRAAVMPELDDLENETFFGKKCISGDDKRLTHLVQAAGWHVRYQEEARIFTPGSVAMRNFLKQRLRWTRNSWRADLRALWEGWAWKKPALAFHLVDRIFQPVTTLIAPIYMGIAIYRQNWIAVTILLFWWLVSRGLKLLPHIRRNPRGVLLIPAYVFFSWVFAIFKIFAFFTMNHQGWITRWDSSRLVKIGKLRTSPAYVATVGLFGLLCFGMFRVDTAYDQFIDGRRFYAVESEIPNYTVAVSGHAENVQQEMVAQAGAVDVNQGLTDYQLLGTDSVASLASKYGLDPAAIVSDEAEWEPGMQIQIQLPFKEHAQFRQGLREDDTDVGAFYLPETNTIILGGSGAIDIPTLRARFDDNRIISYKGDGVYLVKANIFIENYTTLLIEAPDVNWVQLESNESGFVRIETIGGNVVVNGAQVSSWDSDLDAYDENYEDGRSYVLIRNARMDIVDAEMAYLGYSLDNSQGKGGVYGVSWRITNEERFGQELTTGYVENSKFHHNYFGVYTFGATGMIFRNNEFNDNVQYGFDPHDDSNNFIIEYNHAYNNGNHGMIISRRCVNNVLRYNISENNALHGIMLDRQSNNNSVYGNTLSGNRDGIAIWDSHSNLIYENQLVANTRGLRLNRDSGQNIVRNNQVLDSSQYGIYLYDEAQTNQIFANLLRNNQTAVYLRADNNYVNANEIDGGKRGIYLTDEANRNYIFGNEISNAITAIYLKTDPDDYVYENLFADNEHNIEISTLWRLNVAEADIPSAAAMP